MAAHEAGTGQIRCSVSGQAWWEAALRVESGTV